CASRGSAATVAPAPQATDTSHSPLGGRTTRNTRLYGAGAGGASDSAGVSAVAAGGGVGGADRADGVGGALGRSPGLERSGLTVADGARGAGGAAGAGFGLAGARGSAAVSMRNMEASISGPISTSMSGSGSGADVAFGRGVSCARCGARPSSCAEASSSGEAVASGGGGCAACGGLTAGGGGGGGASFSRARAGIVAADVRALAGLSSTEGCVGALSGGPSGSWRSSVSRASALNTLEQRPQRT